MQGMSVATKIEYPIKVINGDVEEIVGQFYATISRDLEAISIQLYISNKELTRANMTVVQSAYDEFYKSIISESLLAGYEFMKPIDKQ